MTQTNIIVNGTFDLGSAGWSGTDLETTYPESAYLSNGSGNRVAEMDGESGQITVMQQTVSIENPLDTALTFQSALRTASNRNAGAEGFRVDVLNDQGQVIATQTFLPTSNSMTSYAMPVSFPDAGSYTIRLTELGPNDSLGAIIDNVSMLVCFAAGTLIETDIGSQAVEHLTPGTMVWTEDAGYQQVQWIGRRRITTPTLIADPTLSPVIFAPGSLGDGLPDRALGLSPQHRLCLGGWRAELHFGQPEVLVPAHALVNGTTICQPVPDADVTYVHFLLDGHQIVRSHGVLSESFFPSALSLTGLDKAARAEVLRLFPDLDSLSRTYPRTARRVVRASEARLVA